MTCYLNMIFSLRINICILFQLKTVTIIYFPIHESKVDSWKLRHCGKWELSFFVTWLTYGSVEYDVRILNITAWWNIWQLQQFLPKRHKYFGTKICKLCESKEYFTWQCVVGKDKKFATTTMTITHAILTRVTAGFENLGHKLYMDNVFFPDLCDDLHKTTDCCGTVRPHWK